MQNDDDDVEYTAEELADRVELLYETAQAMLALSDMKRRDAERDPTEALQLRMEAAEIEADGWVLLRELVEIWAGPPKPDPGHPAQHPDAPARNAAALARLTEISDRYNLIQSAPVSPLPGSPRSPSQDADRGPLSSHAEAPEAGKAPRASEAFIHGRAAANSEQHARPALKRA